MHFFFARPRSRRWPTRRLLLASLTFFACGFAAAFSRGDEPERSPIRLQLSKQAWTRSTLKGSPEPPPPYRVVKEPRLDNISWPICARAIPGDEHFLLVIDERSAYAPSRLLLTRSRPASPAPESDREQPRGKDRESRKPESSVTTTLVDFAGVAYDIAFHPQFQDNGYVYIGHHEPKRDGAPHCVITRYTMTTARPYELKTDSAKTILQWRSNGHNGAAIAFDLDGMLLVTSGDGTVRRDTDQVGQRLDSLRSKVLRINVDEPAPNRAYSIPADNPFLDFPGARGETWCYGLRNPWRITVDPKRGDVWVGNNGQDAWEQVYRIQRGANYGWSVYEGGQLFIRERERGPTPISPPTFDHPHSEARSLTGGVVYYGKALPALHGAYLYGDYSTGKIWAAKYEGANVTWHQEIADTSLAITCFFIDAQGELLVADHRAKGGFYRLVENAATESETPFPRRLSKTGLFDSTVQLSPAPGVVRYEVNEPGWHDGATAIRHVAVPAKPNDSATPAAVSFTRNNAWGFPDGTAFAQTLLAPNSAARRLETRVLVKDHGEWSAYSFVWNDEQTDAHLAPSSGQTLQFSEDNLQWRVPPRAQCMSCHSRASNYVLGATLLQMNRDAIYPTAMISEQAAGGKVAEFALNQLDAFRQLGWLQMTDKERESVRATRLPNSRDTDEPLTRRARAYLHANCKNCHVADGGGNAKIILNWATPLEKMNLLNVAPMHGSFGLAKGKLIDPGKPQNSVVAYRLCSLGGGRMPRVGSHEVDQRGAKLIRDWIVTLDDASTFTHELAALREKLQAPTASIRKAIRESLQTTDGAYALAAALHEDSTLNDARRETMRLATEASDSAIRDLLEPFVPANQRVARLGTEFDLADVLGRRGNPQRGREMFTASTTLACRNCHQIGEQGKPLGPRLDQVAKKLSREKILRAIVDPDLEIDPKFATYSVLRDDGRLFNGLIERNAAGDIRVRSTDGEETWIPKTSIEAVRKLPASLMPKMLLKDLTAQEAADLLEFLASLK